MIKKVIHTFFPIRKSIQMKIFAAFMVITLFILILVTTIWYINASNKIKENEIRNVTDNIQHANSNLELMLNDIDHISATIAANDYNVIDVLKSSEEIPTYEWFKEFKKINSFLTSFVTYKPSSISRIIVVGLDGQVYKAGDSRFQNVSLDEPWSKKILDSKGKTVFVKRILKNSVSGSYPSENKIITIGRAIMNSGRALGIVMVDLKYEIIREVFDINYLDKGYIFIVDDEGNLIYHSDPLLADCGNIQDTFFSQLYKRIKNSHGQITTQIGKKKYLAVSYQSSYTNWMTVAVMPNDTFTMNLTKLRSQTLWIALGLFIFALLASIFISRQITKNLKQLRDTMQLVEKGQLSATPSISVQDEVGQLSMCFTRMMNKIQSLMEDIKIRENQKREAEIKALQTQVSPHFLYNTLNTIRYLADLQNIRNISEVTVSLIDLLRTTVGNDSQFISVEEEIRYVKSYVNIQEYKYLDKFSVVYQVDEEILRCKIIKMILQPVIENAIIHGIAPISHPGLISVKVFRDKNLIKFQVTDNGVGMTKEEIQNVLEPKGNTNKLRFSGIGLCNVDERIKLFYGRDYGLKIFSQPGMYTTVEITIPVNGSGEDSNV